MLHSICQQIWKTHQWPQDWKRSVFIPIPKKGNAKECLYSNSQIHTWLLKKTIALTRRTFVGKVMSLLFNTLSRFVIAFLPRSERLLISWLQSPFSVILEPKKIVSHCFHCLPIYLLWSDGTGCHDVHFLNAAFWAAFSVSSFTFIKRLFSSSSLSAIRVVSPAYLRVLIFLPAILILACVSSSLAFHMCALHIS